MKHITQLNEKQFRELVGNKIFSAKFIKKDNTVRDITARLGVVSKLRGGEDSTAHLSQYINIFEMPKDQFRKLNLTTLTEIKANGETYKIGEQ